MTPAERHAALEQIASEVRSCTRCRLHETRTLAVPGEGDPNTEVIFVGEGPGQNEDRQGRPFVGRAGDLLVRLLGSIGWAREQVFITNVVKCRPPGNRDPEPAEIAACEPYLRRQLEVLDPAVVVTLGRHSMGRFMPGVRISQVHGTMRPADPATGARDALVFAMYHPAAALRTSAIERESYEDVAAVPAALVASRERRARHRAEAATAHAAATIAAAEPALAAPAPSAPAGEPNPAAPAARAAPTAPAVPPPATQASITAPAAPVTDPAALAAVEGHAAAPDTDQLTLF